MWAWFWLLSNDEVCVLAHCVSRRKWEHTFIFHSVFLMHFWCIQGQSMFPFILLNSQILLLFSEDLLAATTKKVTTKPRVNLHMHDIMLMVMLDCVFASACPCSRVHQKELSSVGINPERTTATSLGYLPYRKDTTNCLLTPSCHLYTQQSPRRWFLQFPFTIRSRRERHKSTGKWWVSGSLTQQDSSLHRFALSYSHTLLLYLSQGIKMDQLAIHRTYCWDSHEQAWSIFF